MSFRESRTFGRIDVLDKVSIVDGFLCSPAEHLASCPTELHRIQITLSPLPDELGMGLLGYLDGVGAAAV